MATTVPTTTPGLPDYVASAKPVPRENRTAWYKSTAQTYAGVMLWFVFWQSLVSAGGAPGGILSAGVGVALLGIVLAALICHFLFFLVPGLLGMRNGLPLYIIGTSTYGVQGGLIMPGFLMGALQFGWLGVNAFAVARLLCQCFGWTAEAPAFGHAVLATLFAILAAFMGLKGIQYVARVATYLPIIPVVVLLLLVAKTAGGLASFSPEKVMNPPTAAAVQAEAGAKAEASSPAKTDAAAPAAKEEPKGLPWYLVLAVISSYIVGFFATAGAAGVDIAMSNRDERDVQLGGFTGITVATIFAAGLAVLIVAGAHGQGVDLSKLTKDMNPLNPVDLMQSSIIGGTTANLIMILLAISSFPGACFSAFIAVNSFKTTMPKVNPYVSVGIGTLASIAMAVTGVAGKVDWVFGMIGASFGPICGAMVADYLLSGKKWAGPRAGFNMAGWISWAVGFAIGADIIPGIKGTIPALPVVAFAIGFVLYIALAKAGLVSKTLPMPQVEQA